MRKKKKKKKTEGDISETAQRPISWDPLSVNAIQLSDDESTLDSDRKIGIYRALRTATPARDTLAGEFLLARETNISASPR